MGARSNGKSGSSMLPILIKGDFFCKDRIFMRIDKRIKQMSYFTADSQIFL
jgi:hypothetical protein